MFDSKLENIDQLAMDYIIFDSVVVLVDASYSRVISLQVQTVTRDNRCLPLAPTPPAAPLRRRTIPPRPPTLN